MKLKKQKIASLHLLKHLKGGNVDADHVAYTQPPSVDQTNIQVCNPTEQISCTMSLNPQDCHTNDGTVKTWNQQIDLGNLPSQNKFC